MNKKAFQLDAHRPLAQTLHASTATTRWSYSGGGCHQMSIFEHFPSDNDQISPAWEQAGAWGKGWGGGGGLALIYV